MKTTKQVAEELGVERNHLTATLSNHPGLRPKEKKMFGPTFGYYVWTDEEIEVVRQYYDSVKTGRPRKERASEPTD